jgi:phosphoribosyl-ATP pyrophosphohydrolase
MSSSAVPLEKLERTIASRAKNPNAKSYTSKLLAGGIPMIGAKVTEEAAEVVEAAAESGEAGREHFVREVGDLVYHLLVLMQHRSMTLADLEGELARRFGVSGLAEKASRSEKPADAADAKPVAPKSKAVKPVAPKTKTGKKKVAKLVKTTTVKKKKSKSRR